MSEEKKIDVIDVVAPVEEAVQIENTVQETEVVETVETVEVSTEAEASEFTITDEEIKELYARSLKEIVEVFDNLVAKGDQQEMYKYAESIKASFYKALKREKITMGLLLPAETVTEDESGETVVVSSNPFFELEKAFKDIYSKYKSLRTKFIQDQELKKEAALVEKQNIIEELKALLDTQEDLNRTFPAFRALQTKWRESGPVPQAKMKDIYDVYQHYVEMFYDYVKINNEFRDLDFKKNLAAKEALCLKAEALIEENNVVTAFNALQKLHEEWKEFGPVEKAQREVIWDRFKVATSAINKKHQGYFEGLKSSQKDNLAAKTTLCEKAEEIAASDIEDSNKWNNASKELEQLQKEWKTIGFASKKENQKIYDRFRAACDKFYGQKREYYSQFKDTMTDNLSAKIALCEQAEALKESTDWKKTTDKLINLQKQWKEIGPVSRKKSDQIWTRFREACDFFFDNKEKNQGGQDVPYYDNLKKKRELLDEIKGYVLVGDQKEDMQAFRDFNARWQEVGFVPFKEKAKIAQEFKQVMSDIFVDFRIPRNIGRFQRSDSPAREVNSARSERDRLVQKFRKKESEIATYENNMGFFANSKNATSLLVEMEKKIELAKQELLDIEQMIKNMDNQAAE